MGRRADALTVARGVARSLADQTLVDAFLASPQIRALEDE